MWNLAQCNFGLLNPGNQESSVGSEQFAPRAVKSDLIQAAEAIQCPLALVAEAPDPHE
jgi:hypothetical protein